jgi:integrase
MARGTGGVYLRGRTWHIYYSSEGIQHKESAKTRIKSEAIALLKRRTGEVSRGEIAIGNPEMSLLLDGVVEDYELNQRGSTEDVRRRVENLKTRWGAVKAKSFTASQVKIHIAERTQADMSPATINRELAIIRRAFSLAKERGQFFGGPTIKNLREDNARQGFFTDEEFKRLRPHLPVWMQMLCTFAYFTGARLGELRAIKWPQIDFTERVARLEKTKNGHPRTVPLSADLLAMLELAKATAKTACVFENDGQPIGKFDIYEPWGDACKAANLTGRLFHDFRRTGVRNLVRAGVPQQLAMSISGHKTDSMFRRYNIITEADVKDAMRKVEVYLEAVRAVEVLPPAIDPRKAN